VPQCFARNAASAAEVRFLFRKALFHHPQCPHPKNPPDEAAASNSPYDLLLFVAFTTFFRDFSPKIACQAPKRPNAIRISNIQVAF
jgi:hypothetical protein